MKFLSSKDYPIDLSEVATLLTKHDIPHVLRPHPVFALEPQIKKLIGYSPAGEYQIVIPEEERIQYSIIRGFVSFGSYEIMNLEDRGMFSNPERYDDPHELVADLKKDMANSN